MQIYERVQDQFLSLNVYNTHICVDCLHLIYVALPSFIILPRLF